MAKSNSQNISPDQLGKYIKELRLAAGLKQSAFVGELISSGYISLIEQGKRQPSKQALEHIARVLGVSSAELLEPKNQEISNQVRVQLANIELHLANLQVDLAQEILEQLPETVRHSLLCRAIQTEIDYGKGNFMAAEIACLELMEDAFEVEDWQILRRGILTFGRIANRLNCLLECQIYLSQLRTRLLRIEGVDALLLAQLTASLADRYMHLGDSASSMKLLANLEELLPKVSDRRGLGSALWVKSNTAYAAGDYERALSLATEAQSYFAMESDEVARAILQSMKFSILNYSLPEGDSRLVEVKNEIDELLAGKFSSGHFLNNVLLDYRADIQVKLGEYQEALSIYENLLEKTNGDAQDAAEIYSQMGQIYIKLNNFELAENYLEKSLSLMKDLEIDPSMRRQIILLAERFEAVGNSQQAIKALKLTYKPAADFSIMIKD